MRLLFSTTHGTGHVTPLLPYVHAARAAGHDVLLAGTPPIAAVAEREGLPYHPLTWPAERVLDVARANVAARLGLARMETAASELFIGAYAAAALPDLLELVETWRPDVVLHETAEVAAALAADAYNVPTVRVSVALAAPFETFWLMLAAGALDDLRAASGLRPDLGARRLAATPMFTQAPSALDRGQGEVPPDVRRFRVHDVPATVAPRLDGDGDADPRPLVPISFGTAVPVDGHYPDLYRAAIDAIAPLPVRSVVTVGRQVDPAALGPVPENVRVAPWVPMDELLAEAAALVTHGGAGTTLAALAHGVPMAFVPMSADQPLNAELVAGHGAGIALEGSADAVRAGLREAVQHLLEDRSHGDAARALADDIAELPPVAEAVAAIEALAPARAPVSSAR
jgi:UDP:flavonoid glycosyltransferase YjiC (YdhE family)